MQLKFLLLIFVITFFCPNCLAQKIETTQKDSVKFYKDIELYSKRSSFSKFVHKLLFRSTKQSKPSKSSKQFKNFINHKFDINEGKIIRKITIETLDPFGYSISNSNDKPRNGFEKFGNSVHLKSKNWTIKNLLLFKKNDRLDSLVAKESERLIRSQRYIRSVLIQPIDISNSKDSVDISIRVLDSWSLIPTGAISDSKGNLELTERNFLGLGHEFENNFTNRFENKANGHSLKYSINNIYNSFVNSSFYYENDLDNNNKRSLKVERLFFSSLTKNAGGVFFENKFYRDSLPNAIGDFKLQDFKLKTQDFWYGHSFKLFKANQEKHRTTNLISTFRYQQIEYLKKPDIEFDSTLFFNSEKIYLASIGINSQKFAQEKNLFNFGVIEDVPYGKIYSITTGFQEKNNLKRGYLGGRISYGNYFNFGYLSSTIEYGSFFNNGDTQESTLRIDLNYFTRIIEVGNWKIRQFIKPTIVLGNNRNQNIKDRLSINDNYGINGFNSEMLLGTKKWITSFQTQTYSPKSWYGFRFNPYITISMAMIGYDNNWWQKEKLYTSFGVGVLINNDYLIFNRFQLSLSFYPTIPNEGDNIFKTNSFKNNDIAIPNYQIGKPTIVPFN